MDTKCNLFVHDDGTYTLFFKDKQFDITQAELDKLGGMLMRHLTQERLTEMYRWSKKPE